MKRISDLFSSLTIGWRAVDRVVFYFLLLYLQFFPTPPLLSLSLSLSLTLPSPFFFSSPPGRVLFSSSTGPVLPSGRGQSFSLLLFLLPLLHILSLVAPFVIPRNDCPYKNTLLPGGNSCTFIILLRAS
ncbi:hypothetical protein BJX96DRAFT_34433 [Aspergillus floccosus]